MLQVSNGNDDKLNAQKLLFGNAWSGVFKFTDSNRGYSNTDAHVCSTDDNFADPKFRDLCISYSFFRIMPRYIYQIPSQYKFNRHIV